MNYLEAYLKLVCNTPSPEIYHKFTALFIAGAAANRKVWFSVAHRKLFPNLYVVFVSGPGSYKGTAMSIGRSIFNEDTTRHILTAPNRTTLAALLRGMHRDQQAAEAIGATINGTKICFCDELVDFVGLRDLDRLTFLNDLYDGTDKFDYATIARGYESIKFPCFCILGCTTRGMLTECLGKQGFDSGFASRTIFVSSEESTYKCFLSENNTDESGRNVITNTLSWIQSQHGSMSIEDAALKRYDQWQKELDDFRRTNTLDAAVQSFFSREPTQVAKLAMIYALCNMRRRITIEDVNSAISLMNIVEQGFEPLYRASGNDPDAGYRQTIIDSLNTMGTLRVDDLFATHWHNIPENRLTLVLNRLVNAGHIEEFVCEQGKIHFRLKT